MAPKKPLRGDELDNYLKRMHSHMSARELAAATGSSKSTVSRRLIALRESGQLDVPVNASNGDSDVPDERLAALDELIELLHDELETTGGASLARVSAEYRRALEDRDKLRAEMGITQDNRFTVGLIHRIQMHAGYERILRSAADKGEDKPDPFDAAFSAIVSYLLDRGAILAKDGVLDRVTQPHGQNADE